MEKFLNIFQKEIKDLLTLRMILPFLMSIFLLFFIGRVMQSEVGKAMRPIDIAVIDNDKTNSSRALIEGLKNTDNFISVLSAENDTQAVEIAKGQDLSMVMIIPEGYESNLKNKMNAEIKLYSIITSISIASSAQRGNIRNFLKTINQEAGESFIKEINPELNLEMLREPIKVKEFVVLKDIIQPGSAAFVIAYISTQTVIVPVALLMLIIITGTMIASSIAQEKENKTLETILTVPVSRFTIVLAKMLAAVVLAICFALFFVLAMGSYMSSFSGMETSTPSGFQVSGTGINLSLDTYSKILLGMSIFLSIVNALALATLLALFAQDVKDAQTTIMPLTIMILIPYFFALTFDPGTMSLGLKIFSFLIPFSHTFFAFKFLLLGQKIPIILGNLYLFLFAIVLLFIATKVFSSERILTMKFSFGKFRRMV
uniref:ABC transporter permease n=1 Tax=candidate division WOR-3 bacterium TaxID=2052148 RepID=A0A7V0Z5H1_UNCW3